MDLFDLQGEVALVTGAGSGIGQRLAIGLAEAGADVACFDLPSQQAGLQQSAAKIRDLGRRALVTAGDVTKEADLAAAVAAVESQLGALSIGMNCAGIANAAPAYASGEVILNRSLARPTMVSTNGMGGHLGRSQTEDQTPP